MSKHTPGPWEADVFMYTSTGGSRWEVRTPYSNGMPGEVIMIAPDRCCSFPEARDNARLIAAAPDLFEALKRMEAWYKAGCIMGAASPAIEIARAAIAKAEGK